MKRLPAFFVFLLAAGPALAQQQSTTVQMQCRTLASSGNFLAPDETLVNGMACKPVAASQPTPVPGVAPNPSATPVLPIAPASQPDVPNAATPAAGPVSTKIMPGSSVYIEPMNGFENYLAAALEKKDVPLIPVASEGQARYIIRGTSDEKKAGWAKMAFTGQIHSDDAASVQMFDRTSGAIVFAYAVNKKNTLHGQQTTAEACAKHLKEQIEKK